MAMGRMTGFGAVCAWFFLACASVASRGAIGVGRATVNECGTTWMRQGVFGLATHYFPISVDRRDRVAVDFNVDLLTQAAVDAGAGWVMFTLQHQNWILMAPNETFAKIVGSRDFMTSRDVPRELGRNLRKHHLPLILYVNLRLDPDSHASAAVREAMGGWPPSDRLVANLASVYREYSLRYGQDVAGWWVDSAGVPGFADSQNREQWFGIIKAALLAGNPDAIVAFNPGLQLMRYSRQDDYTAGESNDMTYVPQRQCVDGAYWHTYTYLGGWWGADGTRFSDRELCRYVSGIASHGGAITFDIGTWGNVRAGLNAPPIEVRTEGIPDTKQIQQLNRLRQRIGRGAGAGGQRAVNCE
jgi:hypothetical protein